MICEFMYSMQVNWKICRILCAILSMYHVAVVVSKIKTMRLFRGSFGNEKKNAKSWIVRKTTTKKLQLIYEVRSHILVWNEVHANFHCVLISIKCKRIVCVCKFVITCERSMQLCFVAKSVCCRHHLFNSLVKRDMPI